MGVILVSGIYLSKTATSALCSHGLLLDSSRCLTDSGGFLVDYAKFWLLRVINLSRIGINLNWMFSKTPWNLFYGSALILKSWLLYSYIIKIFLSIRTTPKPCSTNISFLIYVVNFL